MNKLCRHVREPGIFELDSVEPDQHGLLRLRRGHYVLVATPEEVIYHDPNEQPIRTSWPDVWLNVAIEISRRSYDPRLKVGAIIVSADNTQVLSVGYNGNYKGGPHVHESSEPGKSGFIHAEVNALVKCDYNFAKKKHMYITHSPCRACAKLIINAEISRVVYGNLYRDPSGLDLLASAGIEVLSADRAIVMAEER